MYPVSAQFLATLQARSRVVARRAEVWSGPTASRAPQFLASLGTVAGGSVTVDETAEVRRTGTLTLATKGYPADDVIPAEVTDLLHPASGNLIKLYRGFQYRSTPALYGPAGGTYGGGTFGGTSSPAQELVPLGVFRISKPVVQDDNTSLTVTVTLNDLSSWVARQSWQQPYVIAQGANLAVAIQEAMEGRYPGLSYVMSPTDWVLPATTLGAQSGATSDPMSDLQTLATDGGMELFFDVLGQVVLRPVPDPSTQPVVYSFVEGPGCTMSAAGRTLDETQQYNGVIVTANGPGGAPVQAALWDTNPASPTYYLGTWGQVPFEYETTSFPTTGQTQSLSVAQCQAIAASIFPRVVHTMDEPTLSTACNPALQEGDCIEIARERIRLSGNYCISQMTIPLDLATAHTITCRSTAPVPTSG